MTQTVKLLSPAKLNLFLHITGRRPDGYHTLQTVFQLLDWGDRMTFTANNSGVLELDMPGGSMPGSSIPAADNLILRAARLLQRERSASNKSAQLGASIRCEKQIPMGGGLGRRVVQCGHHTVGAQPTMGAGPQYRPPAGPGGHFGC